MIEFFLGKGLLILGLVFLIDDLGVPFPSGSTLFATAILAAHSQAVSPWLLFLVAFSYSVLGNMILYYWGRHGAKRWLHTHGHKFFLSQQRLEKFEDFFERKHGRKTIFLTSLVNNIRAYMALIAGSSGMSPVKFFPYNILGIMIWSGTITALGYLFGEDIWMFIKNCWIQILLIIAILIGLKLGWKRLFPKK